jgi:two-component system, sensor histidine kinase
MNSEQRPDPEDGSHTVAVYWVLRASELLGAFMFATVLPWQQTFSWFAVIGGLSTVRWWHVNQPSFRAQPKAHRKRVYRTYVWILMSFVGSASYFLYVPNNLPIQAVLGCYLLANATLIAIRLTGDIVRTTIALCLAFLPTSFRFLYDGIEGPNLLLMMGIGGILMTTSMVVMSYSQERNIQRQYELRQRAESATDAVAAMGLSKSRFFAAVSHDLRQPVHAIGLYLDPLVQLSQATQNVNALKAVEGIRQSWRALDDLLSQVLDLTRMDSGIVTAELKPVQVDVLVREMVMQHSSVAERAGVRLVSLVKADGFVIADDLMLKRILSNLIDNAIKFSAPGGMVVVALRYAHAAWRLQVRDAGMGIALAAQIKIFEEFVQLDNEARDRRQGLGLGLAISKRFVLLMNGQIAVRSEPGKGTCITVTLPKTLKPLSVQDCDSLLHRNSVPSQPGELAGLNFDLVALGLDLAANRMRWQGTRLLLVEDDALVAAAMVQLLESWGMQVRHVSTASEAIEHSAFSEIAICDVRLPDGASGLDVALRLRRGGKKVVLLTGETNAALRDAAAQCRLPLLTKPVSSAGLLATLDDL